MRFVIDAQLPPALARWLVQHTHVAEHMVDLGLAAAHDREIWEYALANGAMILAKDADFAVRRAHAVSGPAVVWIRRGNTSRRALLTWFEQILPALDLALAEGETLIDVV